MVRRVVKWRGIERDEGSINQGCDFEWVGGKLYPHHKIKSLDHVVVDTYDNGVLIERNIYDAMDTPAQTPLQWERRTTVRFRDEDLANGL